MDKLKENTIVKFSSKEIMDEAYRDKKLSSNPKTLDNCYGIIREITKDGYNIDFIIKSTHTINSGFYTQDQIIPIDSIYDKIKNAVIINPNKIKLSNVMKTLTPDKITPINQNINISDITISGKRILFTGKFSYFNNKEEFIDKLEKAGGKYQPNVSESLDILVTGTSSNFGRISKARECGAIIVPEMDFFKHLING